MCVYNGEAYLRETIASILAQNYGEFEFLIIDDASIDGTPGILESYDDRRIRILRNAENRGLTHSLNAGLREARGSLIARQDADDVSYPGRLAQQVAFMDRHSDVAAVGTQFDPVDERGRRRGPHLWMKCETSLGIRWQLMFENPFVHSSVVFRRDIVLGRLGGYDETFRTNQDFELWSRLGRTYPLRNLHQALVACRGRRASISFRYSADAIRGVREVMMGNVEATIGPDPRTKDGIDVVLRGMNPRLCGPLATIEPLAKLIDSAYRRFVEIRPEAERLREIRVHAASLIARLATIAANASPARMSRWYLASARYDVPTFARGALRFAATGARAIVGRAPLFTDKNGGSLSGEIK